MINHRLTTLICSQNRKHLLLSSHAFTDPPSPSPSPRTHQRSLTTARHSQTHLLPPRLPGPTSAPPPPHARLTFDIGELYGHQRALVALHVSERVVVLGEARVRVVVDQADVLDVCRVLALARDPHVLARDLRSEGGRGVRRGRATMADTQRQEAVSCPPIRTAAQTAPAVYSRQHQSKKRDHHRCH